MGLGSMRRNKGARGERQIIEWLQPICDEIYEAGGITPIILQRNSLQSDRGGSDITGLDWLALEVKNCENQALGSIEKWWEQAKEQAELWPTIRGRPRMPVLAYKGNHRPFRLRMPGACFDLACPDAWIYSPVDISMEDFERYFRSRLFHEVKQLK